MYYVTNNNGAAVVRVRTNTDGEIVSVGMYESTETSFVPMAFASLTEIKEIAAFYKRREVHVDLEITCTCPW